MSIAAWTPHRCAAANGFCGVRSSVAGVRERTVRFTRATEAIAELGRYGFFRPKSAGARLRPLIGFTLGCSTMYRYSPPKSNIWGHSLGRMQASRQRELFAEFLKRAVAGHSFTGGSLTFFLGDAPAFFPVKARGQWGRVTSDDVRRFEQLLGTPALEGAFYSLAAHQCESALTELIQRSALLPGSMLLQGVDISRWLIEGQPVPTQSKVTLYYGMKPCISTFLQFETTGQFEFIKRVLADLAFCKLNEKHLKPIKQRSKKKSGGE